MTSYSLVLLFLHIIIMICCKYSLCATNLPHLFSCLSSLSVSFGLYLENSSWNYTLSFPSTLTLNSIGSIHSLTHLQTVVSVEMQIFVIKIISVSNLRWATHKHTRAMHSLDTHSEKKRKNRIKKLTKFVTLPGIYW